MTTTSTHPAARAAFAPASCTRPPGDAIHALLAGAAAAVCGIPPYLVSWRLITSQDLMRLAYDTATSRPPPQLDQRRLPGRAAQRDGVHRDLNRAAARDLPRAVMGTTDPQHPGHPMGAR